MNVALAMLLAPTLTNLIGVKLTFQDMLDSAQVVVIGRVDSIWYSLVKPPEEIAKLYKNGVRALTNVSAELITVYAKDRNQLIHSKYIHLAYYGGEYPDGTFEEWIEGVKFKKGEVFVAAVRKDTRLSTICDPIYFVASHQWKYVIANDSVYLNEMEAIPLNQALQSLSSAFAEQR